MCDVFKSFNALFFGVLKGEYLLHKVGNKGEHGGEGTEPSGGGAPRDGGDGELVGVAWGAAWTRVGATLFPPADGLATWAVLVITAQMGISCCN